MRKLSQRQNTRHRTQKWASQDATLIRFPQGMLAELRSALLADDANEQFAMLLARRETSPGGKDIFVVRDAVMAGPKDLEDRSQYRVSPSKTFIARILNQARQDLSVNAIIDVHTHPFANGAAFSGVDDADECRFSKWLAEYDSNLGYASILFSRHAWEARAWKKGHFCPARVKTQTMLELPPRGQNRTEGWRVPDMQARTALALGVEAIRMISADQRIVLAGAGGLGSIMAEQLARSGFRHIDLIDPDRLELSNLNRFAGGYRDNLGLSKVSVVKRNLLRIDSRIEVRAVAEGVESAAAQSLMAQADWIIVSTDSHSSRQTCQRTSIKYGVPLISAGVNITVRQNKQGHFIQDRSGEVITCRVGDGFCLHCLGRIDHNRVAAEINPDEAVRKGLVNKGYVQGFDEKEPAVMPLNAIIASMAVQTLLDQYRSNAHFEPVVVYENHLGSRSYPDNESLEALPDTCPVCGRNVAFCA